MTDVQGTPRHFWAEGRTTDAELVWRLWLTPSTWSLWDRGLREAHLDGAFERGAEGSLTDLNGRVSRFVVTRVEAGRRCEYVVPLPGAHMVLVRSLDQGEPPTIRHDVSFSGALGPAWALLLGRRFRRQLGPTVDALLVLAAGETRAERQP